MKYNRINLFLPTYKRVKNGKLPRFLESCVSKVSSTDNLWITFLVNKDDKETRNYLFNLELPICCEMLLTNLIDSPHLGKMYNYIYDRTTFKFPDTVISMVGDDMEWLTPNYDIAILNVINKYNGMAMVYCNDAYIQGKKLCVNLFTTRKYVEATKHPFMCEIFAAYFIDTVWMQVASKTGTAHYLKDVILKHHHYTKNPKNQDITSRRLQTVKPQFAAGYNKTKKYADTIIKILKEGKHV